MSIKKWNVEPIDKKLAMQLAEECEIDAFTALLLCQRGMTDPSDIEEFLSDEMILSDPTAFTDMDKAVERIRTAVDKFEKIAIFGDYDADGVTATALLYSCLEKMGAAVQYRLPTRDEGYGMTVQAIDELKELEVSLIVTVDNGIAANDEIEYAKKCGIDVVVTDHHLPHETLPDAVAVVDPKRADCISEYKNYAGVGVAFMLACALNDCSCEELLDDYGDLVALGTIADIMPLLGDNRALVKYGLNCINSGDRAGIKALINAAGMGGKDISSTSVAFGLAPRINAAGRMFTPDKAVQLLLCEDDETAETLANELCELNTRRQSEEKEIYDAAEQQIYSDPKILCSPVIAVWGENWHNGFIGIVAAKITQKFGKPSVVFSIDGDEACGSARSYKGVSIYDIISKAQEYILKFGGHETAAGLSCKTSDLKKLYDVLCDAAAELYPQMPFCGLDISAKLNPKALSLANVYAQEQLKPFGQGNEQPIYGLFNMTISQISEVGGGKHLRLTLSRDGTDVTAMKFFSSSEQFGYRVGDVIDAAVTLDKNIYNGRESLSVVIKEIRMCGVDYDKLFSEIRAYENYCRFGEPAPVSVPDRMQIAEVYKIIRRNKCVKTNEDLLCARFQSNEYCRIRLILDILNELMLIEPEGDFGGVKYIETDKKVDLESSHILKMLKQREVQG